MDSKKYLSIVLIIIGLITTIWAFIGFFFCGGYIPLYPPGVTGSGGAYQCGYQDPVTIGMFIIGIVILVIGIRMYRKRE